MPNDDNTKPRFLSKIMKAQKKKRAIVESEDDDDDDDDDGLNDQTGVLTDSDDDSPAKGKNKKKVDSSSSSKQASLLHKTNSSNSSKSGTANSKSGAIPRKGKEIMAVPIKKKKLNPDDATSEKKKPSSSLIQNMGPVSQPQEKSNARNNKEPRIKPDLYGGGPVAQTVSLSSSSSRPPTVFKKEILSKPPSSADPMSMMEMASPTKRNKPDLSSSAATSAKLEAFPKVASPAMPPSKLPASATAAGTSSLLTVEATTKADPTKKEAPPTGITPKGRKMMKSLETLCTTLEDSTHFQLILRGSLMSASALPGNIDLSGMFSRDETQMYDFFDTNTVGDIVIPEKIPIFPEEFPPGFPGHSLHWWGIVDPAVGARKQQDANHQAGGQPLPHQQPPLHHETSAGGASINQKKEELERERDRDRQRRSSSRDRRERERGGERRSHPRNSPGRGGMPPGPGYHNHGPGGWGGGGGGYGPPADYWEGPPPSSSRRGGEGPPPPHQWGGPPPPDYWDGPPPPSRRGGEGPPPPHQYHRGGRERDRDGPQSRGRGPPPQNYPPGRR